MQAFIKICDENKESEKCKERLCKAVAIYISYSYLLGELISMNAGL